MGLDSFSCNSNPCQLAPKGIQSPELRYRDIFLFWKTARSVKWEGGNQKCNRRRADYDQVHWRGRKNEIHRKCRKENPANFARKIHSLDPKNEMEGMQKFEDVEEESLRRLLWPLPFKSEICVLYRLSVEQDVGLKSRFDTFAMKMKRKARECMADGTN